MKSVFYLFSRLAFLSELQIELLKNWFIKNGRTLPWREDPTPYKVWISEVMLQQTQVAVVIPYFERWMELFPSIQALACAPLEQVLKCWEGLGYYTRARHLHEAACFLVRHYGGELPSKVEELAKIKGIGPYTQGAIRSFAFRQKAAAVDGNVLRVLARFWAFEKEIDSQKTKAYLQKELENALPENEPWIISEALIELGALVCQKKPKCFLCPLQKECLAFRHNLQGELPKRRERPKICQLIRTVVVITCNDHYLLQQGEAGKVMAGLYEFPYLEEEIFTEKEIVQSFEKKIGLTLEYLKPLAMQSHTFTRFRARLFPHLLQTAKMGFCNRYFWKPYDELVHLPFSSGHRRILTTLIP